MDDGIALTIISWIIHPFTQPEFWLIILGVWVGCGITAASLRRTIYRGYQYNPDAEDFFGISFYLLYAILGPFECRNLVKQFSSNTKRTP